MRLDLEHKEYDITLFDKDDKLIIEIWADRSAEKRIESLSKVEIVIVKGGISGILGPDISINLGETLQKIRQEALDRAKEVGTMEMSDEEPLDLE